MDFAEYARHLRQHRGERVDNLAVIATTCSTNTLARRVVNEYSQEGTPSPELDLVAWKQSAGQGRDGRGWESPAGQGIYVTLVRAAADPAQLQLLPLLVAVSLCNVVNAYLDDRCGLKWPNDLMVGERKLGGILIEVLSRAADPGTVIIGFGLNHGAKLTAFETARSTSLRHENPRAPDLATVTSKLIDAVDLQLSRMPRAETAVAAYEALSIHRPGDRLRCRMAGETLVGTFQGFDQHGFLRLLVAGDERRLPAGEVVDHG